MKLMFDMQQGADRFLLSIFNVRELYRKEVPQAVPRKPGSAQEGSKVKAT
jgi:hypothetical protein